MTEATAKRRIATTLTTLVITACVAVASADDAGALPYTVVSCDAAGLFGYSSAAWAPFASGGGSYATCPSSGGELAGISNRLVAGTYPGFTHSGHAFTAPPGTTITRVKWAGRMARGNCAWGTFFRALPSGNAVMGVPNGQFCGTTGWDTRGWPVSYPVPGGTTRLDQLVICGASQCQPGATLHSHVLEVTIDDPVPPSISLSGPLASGEWVSGALGLVPVSISAVDNSGVQRVDATVGPLSAPQTFACNWATSAPCAQRQTEAAPAISALPDGSHSLRVSAVDAAGNSAAVTRAVLVDNTAPDPIQPVVAGGNAWRNRSLFHVSWTKPTQQAAPITRAHWKLCTASGPCPARDQVDIRSTQELQITAPAAGEYALHVWLEDAAGNKREANGVVTAPIRFDPEPPQLTFQPVNPNDPLRVAVNAHDDHSGIASGEIEMRATDGSVWHTLPTELTESELVAYVDDERFTRGTYAFRARATDHAGNETSTGTRADGVAATLRLPARVDTHLAVGVSRKTVRRRIVRRGGRRRVVRRRVRVLDAHVTARHGQTVRLAGRLTNADGQPLQGASIEALEFAGGDSTLPLGFATADEHGRFRYLVRATRNRDLTFRYPGSRRIGSAIGRFKLRVPAATRIGADSSHLANGQEVSFTGRVTTRPLPATGKLIEMQAYFRGRWRTISTVRTARDGRWSFPYLSAVRSDESPTALGLDSPPRAHISSSPGDPRSYASLCKAPDASES